MKKILSTTQPKPKYNLVDVKETILVVNKFVKIVINKSEGTRKGLVEHDMGHDIVEDIKKTKENISLFELCNFPQQRRKFLEAFDPHPNSIPESIESDDEVNEASIGGKSRSQILPFLLSFEIFNHNVHDCLVDFRASSNAMPLSICKMSNVQLIPSPFLII